MQSRSKIVASRFFSQSSSLRVRVPIAFFIQFIFHSNTAAPLVEKLIFSKVELVEMLSPIFGAFVTIIAILLRTKQSQMVFLVGRRNFGR